MEEEFNLIKKIEGIIKDLEWAIIYDKKIRSNEYCKGEIHGLKLALDLNKEFIQRETNNRQKTMEKEFDLSEKICRNCGYNKFGTYLNVLICSKCGHPKTKRGIEKFENLNKF